MFRLFFTQSIITVLLTIRFIPVYLASLFLKKDERALYFREWFVRIVRGALYLTHTQVHTENNSFLHDGTIFVTRHTHVLDMHIFLALLGPHTIPVVYPLKKYKALLRIWLRHMGAIDVVRNNKEHQMYGESNTKSVALHKALKTLKKRDSLLIFSESHSGLWEEFYLPHAGFVHLSYASQSAVQTLVVKDMNKVLCNGFSFGSNVVTVHFRKCFFPESGFDEHVLLSTEHKVKEKIQVRTIQIELELEK